jgi:DHA2 family multidrug resistance protein-like MFS transporter
MTKAASVDGVPMPRRLYAIIAMTAGNILAVMDGNIVNVALPTIARDLHVAGSSAILIVTVYQLTLVMLLLPLSSLGARIGLRRVYQFGQALFAVTTLLCFFANSLPFLLIVRIGQGIGAAAVLSVSAALIRSIYPSAKLGRGLAFNTVVICATSAAAPTLGGLILGFAPWPWIFALGLPFALLSLLFGRNLPTTPLNRRPYDYQSALMSAGTFGLIIGGLESGVHGDSPVVAAAIVLAGGILAVFFVRRELRSHLPIMPVDLLGQRTIAMAAFGSLCAYVGSMIFLVSIPFRLQHGYGFTPETTGAMMAPWPASMMIFAPIAGALSDRFPAGLLGSIGMSIACIALLTMAWLPIHPTYWDIAWRMAMCGASFGLFFSPTVRLIIGSAPKARVASAGGLTSTTRLLGQTLGATVTAIILARAGGDGPLPALISAGLAGVALLCCLTRMNPALRRHDPKDIEEAQMAAGV